MTNRDHPLASILGRVHRWIFSESPACEVWGVGMTFGVGSQSRRGCYAPMETPLESVLRTRTRSADLFYLVHRLVGTDPGQDAKEQLLAWKARVANAPVAEALVRLRGRLEIGLDGPGLVPQHACRVEVTTCGVLCSRAILASNRNLSPVTSSGFRVPLTGSQSVSHLCAQRWSSWGGYRRRSEPQAS